MPVAGVALRSLIATTGAFSAPSLVVLVAFAVYESIPVGHALLVWAALTFMAFLLLRRRQVALDAMRAHVDAAADRLGEALPDAAASAEAPEVTEPALAALGAGVERLVRQVRDDAARAVSIVRARDMVIDAVPEPLLLLTRDGRVAGANQAARRLLGNAVAGRDLAEVLRHPQVLEAAHAALAGGAPDPVEVTMALPADRVFAVRIDRLAEITADGAAALLMLSDLTGIKRAERMRADFIANVSHELRTPLASIVGFIETLRGPARDDTAAHERFLEIMNQQAQRMARLVADLLSLSRIEQNEHLPPTARVDLAQVLGTVKATLDLAAQRRTMTIVLDLDPALPAVLGDPDELQQVFQNLIDNAIKYGRSGTAVTVTGRVTDDPPPAFPRAALPRSEGRARRVLSIAVADRGAGIARHHLPRLTERFYRVDVARSREGGGTGLGLAIVKHIVGHHRGALTIDSREGQGTTFTVYLPEFPR